ncbi:hypothetical protein ACJ4V0_13095 [Phreatobacter sp. HK31-P]
MAEGLNDPETRRKTITALLIVAVPMFVFGYLMALWYGLPNFALFLGACTAGMALGAAGVIALFGPGAPTAFAVIATVATILAALFGR